MLRPSSTGSRRKRSREVVSDRILHLDPFSGISGNMFLGALLDLGLPRRAWTEELAGLPLEFRFRISRVQRGALSGKWLRVMVPKTAKHGRHYAEIRKTITKAKIDSSIRERSLSVFEGLAQAEARVHGIPVEKVHFHEVGAVDAIVDIVGAAAGLALLDIKHVTASSPAIGYGQVNTAHGVLPLPAPATLELLRGMPTVPAHVEWETVTPTGAALLREFVSEFTPWPAMEVQAIGYGAGDDREGPMPNLLRATLGRSRWGQEDRIVGLETNLDDFSPEHLDYLMEQLFEAGALDVSIQTIQMKKNRPGFLVRVLSRPMEARMLSEVLFRESSTLGVRRMEMDRWVLEREELRVKIPGGSVRVKKTRSPEGRLDYSAEYEDCKRIARKTKRPLRDLIRAVEEKAREEED